jgi:hypothetical protein
VLGPEPARDVLDQGALIRSRDGAMNMATSRGSPRLIGAAVGALIGLVGRVALLVPFLKDLGGADAIMVGVISGAIGLFVGGAAGATGRLVLGAIVGAALSALISAGTFWLMLAAGSLFGAHTPSFIPLVVAGALAGGIGGASAQMAARRRVSGAKRAPS